MMRLRAVPSAVWTAVGALAFLASTGLVVVLSAGLHVWGGPATRIIDAAGHVLRGAGSGIVRIPGAAHLAHPTTPVPPTTPAAPRTASGPATVPRPAPPGVRSPSPAPQRPAVVTRRPASRPEQLRGGLPSFFRDLGRLGRTVDRALVTAEADLGGPVKHRTDVDERAHGNRVQPGRVDRRDGKDRGGRHGHGRGAQDAEHHRHRADAGHRPGAGHAHGHGHGNGHGHGHGHGRHGRH